MLNIHARLARSNVDNFKNRDYQEFKGVLEQKILDASQKGYEFVVVVIPTGLDHQRMIQEIVESEFEVSEDTQVEEGYQIRVSWNKKEEDL